MSKLHEIAGGQNAARVADVVFVHGLSGSALGTWSTIGSGESHWGNWLAKDLPNIGVWSLGYEAAASDWLGHSMPLEQRAREVLDNLELDGMGKRPLIFIVHSLGGLVIKRMLRTAADSGVDDYKTVRQQTKGILFLATPHNGSKLANYLGLLGQALPVGASVAVKDLEAKSRLLHDLTDWFSNNYEPIKVAVMFETKKTKNAVIVVDEDSANPGISKIRRVPVDEDHFSIAAPKSTDAHVYKSAVAFIKSCIEEPKPDPR